MRKKKTIYIGKEKSIRPTVASRLIHCFLYGIKYRSSPYILAHTHRQRVYDFVVEEQRKTGRATSTHSLTYREAIKPLQVCMYRKKNRNSSETSYKNHECFYLDLPNTIYFTCLAQMEESSWHVNQPYSSLALSSCTF